MQLSNVQYRYKVIIDKINKQGDITHTGKE